MDTQQFLQSLDALIGERHMLQHPFYQLWNEGALTLPILQEYAKEYYLHVHTFPTYVSATHARCHDLSIRQMLLENLIEEEQGPDNHPELWIRFAEALGVSREALLQHRYLPQTRIAVELLRELAFRPNPAEGLAALYAYESQVPEVAAVKIEGLKRYYGIADERGLSFFTVHLHADEIHRAVVREALAQLCATESERQRALEAACEAADALNLLLDGVYQTYCVAQP
ncbi:MAG: CADD family putative folate metabolism protein [Candidatus Kapabacteria bacterium]|nr:CADD family putative folate metabolism protein [Candidatus Kapabacteria bacterium]MCS7170617.1 CADD family putative folate metabolism protein [Candidatus Kapabacteria bacterium]MDW7996935.1 CADD family putative folate metabolism protein [Bacteroidota bacterium]